MQKLGMQSAGFNPLNPASALERPECRLEQNRSTRPTPRLPSVGLIAFHRIHLLFYFRTFYWFMWAVLLDRTCSYIDIP